MQTVIITSDKTSWALRPQAYLLDKYWPQHGDILIGGYSPLPFTLSPSFHFQSIGAFADYPVDRWTNGLIEFLASLSDDLVLFMMDDYWLNRAVDHNAVMWLADYMRFDPSIARFDLTSDRLGARGWKHYGAVGHIDVIESDPNSPYHFSFQAAIWRRVMLLNCLEVNQTPWQSEIHGDQLLREAGYRVLGTLQCPLRYTIAVQRGQLALDGGYQTAAYALPKEDIDHIESMGWLPEYA